MGQYPAHGQYPAGPAHPGPGPDPLQARRPRRGLVIALVVVGLLVVGFVARVATRVQDAGAWAATTVTLPGSLLSYPRQPELEKSGVLRAQVTQLSSQGGEPVVGAYGRNTTTPDVVVMGVKMSAPMSDADQRKAWDSILEGVRAQGGSKALNLTDRPAGELGGRVACGTLSIGPLACISVDQAVLLVVMGPAELPGGIDSLASVRTQVEHRP
jgi:hypothetical protein